jgi:PHD/YefM family antitoxin component YafN of YafNO toxin-antitoxin module
MAATYTPTNARKNLYFIIKHVNSQQEPVEIVPTNGDKGVVVVASDFWHSLQETLYLEQTGVLARVEERERDDTGFTSVDELDWDRL